ncbi:hypothetical protein [Sphingobacterium spiritivorum]|uniref:hypothetical protein n=1 Tax=Sphingobacterium spiritivorum TaxID=258 RepID=UPI001917C036|nr:hypothetical protein [Sphingobacterium spiritivorum]QQT26038.1 hypothetical protein I6J02_20420 [Sphingobacterium spiritivorum]
MPENIQKIKKKISEEWISSVPQFSFFAQNKFYRVVGCLVIGIEAVNVPNIEGYKPHFVIYPLWKDDLKKCMDAPSIYFSIENKKRLEFSIPYLKHNIYFNDVIECLKKELPILWNDSISLRSLFTLIDNRFNDILIKTNSSQQAKLFELKFYAALYTGNQSQVQNVINQIQQASKKWNIQMFEMWHGKLDVWLQSLQEVISNRDEFLKQIEVNKQDKKIAKLQSSELIA